MPPALVLLLAADEKSKTPFYIAAGLLAAWAVMVAVLGISRLDFPGSAGRGRAVMGLSALLVAATIGTAIATASKPSQASETKPGERQSAGGSPGGKPATGPLALAADRSGALRYDRKTLTAPAGKVTIDFTNRSPVSHNVTLVQGTRRIAASKTIASASTAVSANLKAGTYTFFCSVDAHRQAGMQGTLTVR